MQGQINCGVSQNSNDYLNNKWTSEVTRIGFQTQKKYYGKNSYLESEDR